MGNLRSERYRHLETLLEGVSTQPDPRITARAYAVDRVLTHRLLGLLVFSGLLFLVFASIYWKKVTRAGAISSVLVMIGTWSYFFWNGLVVPTMEGATHEGEYLILGLMPVTFIFLAGAYVLIRADFERALRRDVADPSGAPVRGDVMSSSPSHVIP